MVHDLVVRGGLLVDGTSAPARRADVAVDDGVFTEIGDLEDERGREEVDASGFVVIPGIIAPHTHLDAQLCWDGEALPSALHGVTTVLVGMCGFGVAPCPPGGSEYLANTLERVEEIPAAVTLAGVPFTWTTFGEYLDHLDALPLAVNVGAMVPHSALRFSVMGDRARGETATDDDRRELRATLAAALTAGGLGFATSRGPNHEDADGAPVPSRFAHDDELRDLVLECRGRPWQINARTKFGGDPNALVAEISGYAAFTAEAGARLTWSPFHAEPGWEHTLAAHDRFTAQGVEVRAQVAAEPLAVYVRDGPHAGTQLPVLNRDERGIATLIDDDRTLIGLGDAGAHVMTISNYTYPTTMLAKHVRDDGAISLERAVHRMTGHPAAFFGLNDRGRVVPGCRADLAVVDLDRLELEEVRVAHDLPGGGDRLFRAARGYETMIVNGVVVRRGGAVADARPGRVLRSHSARR